MQGNQRWRERRSFFRRPEEQIRVADYEVGALAYDRAKAFVEAHHYSGSFGSSVRRFGLFRKGVLAGVASFGNPMNDRSTEAVFGAGTARRCLELNRLVLLDAVPGNGESFFVGRCFQLLRTGGFRGVVSFSDPCPRTRSDGAVVFVGHFGTVYQALNAAWLGRGKSRLLRLLPDGTAFPDRKVSKIRGGEQGWQYCAQDLVEHGAEPYQTGQSRTEWLSRWLKVLTRPLRHPGNLKYAWDLSRAAALRSVGPYPKRGAA